MAKETYQPLTPAEVAECIGMREFMQLCEFADLNFGTKIYGGAQRGAWGMKQDLFFVGDRIQGVRFEILAIKIEGRKKEVIMRVGKAVQRLYWDNVKYFPERVNAQQEEKAAG